MLFATYQAQFGENTWQHNEYDTCKQQCDLR
jgi:hypothetical protein